MTPVAVMVGANRIVQAAGIIHPLGNLITYGPFNNAEPNNRGAVAFAWKKDMVYDEPTQKATMNGDVAIVFRSDDEKALRRRIVEQALQALRTEVAKPTVFTRE